MRSYGLRSDLLAVTQAWKIEGEEDYAIAAKGAPEPRAPCSGSGRSMPMILRSLLRPQPGLPRHWSSSNIFCFAGKSLDGLVYACGCPPPPMTTSTNSGGRMKRIGAIDVPSPAEIRRWRPRSTICP